MYAREGKVGGISYITINEDTLELVCDKANPVSKRYKLLIKNKIGWHHESINRPMDVIYIHGTFLLCLLKKYILILTKTI